MRRSALQSLFERRAQPDLEIQPDPVARRRGPRIAAVFGVCALFAWAAVLNGYPFVFSDTGAYLQSGFHAVPLLDGTAVYGVWLRLGAAAGTLWLPTIAQILILGALVTLALTRLARVSQPAGRLLATAAVIAAGTALPQVAGLLMPDVFLPIGLLALGLWAVGMRRRWEGLLLASAVVVSALSAFSNLCVLTLTLPGLAVAARAGWLSRRRAFVCGLVVALCWPAVALVNGATRAPSTFSYGWKGYALSTLAESGELGPFLAQRCGDAGLPMCSGSVPERAVAFLWSPESAFVKAGGFGARQVHSRVLEAYFQSPGRCVTWAWHAAGRALAALLSTGADPGVYGALAEDSATVQAVDEHVPRDRARLSRARQMQSPDHPDGGGGLALLLTLGSAAALILRRRDLTSPQRAFALLMVSGVLGSAWVSAALGMPGVPRAGARVSFLLPLLAFAFVADPVIMGQRAWAETRRLRAGALLRNPTWLRAARAALGWVDGLFLLTWIALFAKLMLANATFGFPSPVPAFGSWLVAGLRRLLVARDPSILYHHLYLVSLGSVLLALSWTLLLSARASRIALWGMNVFLSLLIFSDAIYCRYFHDFLSIPVLAQVGQVGELGKCLPPLLRVTDLLFAADLVLVGLWLWRGRRSAEVRPRARWLSRLSRFVVTATLGGLAAGLAGHWALRAEPILATNTWSRQELYSFVGLLGVHAIGTKQFVVKKLSRQELSPQRRTELEQWFAGRARLREATTPLTGVARGKNVIVVQMEAFQDFVIGKTVGGVEITPNLNALLPQLLYLPNYYHQTSEGRTSDAEFVSNCSLLPVDFGSVYVRYSNDHFVCLPGVLRAAGYATAAFHGNDRAFYKRYYVYPRIGFDQFFDLSSYEVPRVVGWAVGDRAFFRQTVEKLKGLPQPFYAFMITLSSHYPFGLPDDLQTLPLGPIPPGLLANYLQAMHYLDSAVGQLVKELKDAGLWEDSLILLYGDHDDGIPDNDPAYTALLGHPLVPLDRVNFADRVGLFVHVPQERVTGRRDEPAGQYDLAPTVLDALAMDSTRLPWLGQKVLAPDPDPLPLRYGAFVGKDLVSLDDLNCVRPSDGAQVPAQTCNARRPGIFEWFKRSQEVIELDLQREMAPKTKP